MGAIVPGPVGVVVFAGVKFTGYFFAVKGLKALQPAIAAGAAKIAGVRTGLGLLLGPPSTMLIGYATSSFVMRIVPYNSFYPFYTSLIIARILIWALVIFLFARKTAMNAGSIWLFAIVGAAWSCLLDIPGYKLAIISPGKIVIC